MPDQDHASSLEQKYEPRPDPQSLTYNTTRPSENAPTNVDYEPHPESSLPLSPSRQAIVTSITNLYSGSCTKDGTGENDMKVYAPEAIYDDPWSYCDTRYKIAGQWYGIPKIFISKTLKTEVVENAEDRIVYKQQQEYTIRGVHVGKKVNSLISLTLERDANGEEKVRYHKDMWNEKDYSHEGLGRAMKEVNGDWLTKVTRPPGWLKEGAESEGVK